MELFAGIVPQTSSKPFKLQLGEVLVRPESIILQCDTISEHLGIFLSLFFGFLPGHALLDWMFQEGAVELPENIMNDGRLYHLQ